jgi:RNA-directed DNA polymerase
MVKGTRSDAEALWDETSRVLAPMGLRLSEEKTGVCHIDEGFDFLGYRIQRRSWQGRANKRAIYTYPSKKALASVMTKVKSDHSPTQTSNARRPAAPAQPGAAGMV